MIWNVIDRRTRPYRWKKVNAIVEAVEHDNSCADADQAPESPVSYVVDYDCREGISIRDAVVWAEGLRCHVALYLYDDDDMTNTLHVEATEDRF